MKRIFIFFKRKLYSNRQYNKKRLKIVNNLLAMACSIKKSYTLQDIDFAAGLITGMAFSSLKRKEISQEDFIEVTRIIDANYIPGRKILKNEQ